MAVLIPHLFSLINPLKYVMKYINSLILLVGFLFIGSLFGGGGGYEVEAQHAQCSQFSDVRPSPTARSPREQCECEFGIQSSCAVPVATTPAAQQSYAKAACSARDDHVWYSGRCRSCSAVASMGAVGLAGLGYAFNLTVPGIIAGIVSWPIVFFWCKGKF